MAAVYHINGDSVSPCRAKKGHCPYGQSEENNHFSDAGEAMAVLEYRLSKEYENNNSGLRKNNTDLQRGVAVSREIIKEYVPRVSEGEKPEDIASSAKNFKTAEELAEDGAEPKEIRDALRREHPYWIPRQIHTVQQAMSKKTIGSKTSKNSATPIKKPLTNAEVKQLHVNLKNAKEAAILASTNLSNAHKISKEYDKNYGVQEGRAYYTDYTNGYPGEKKKGLNPNGHTYYEPSERYEKMKKKARQKYESAIKAEKDAQTAIEEEGLGHTLPDEGNTIRVRTQAQKWLLENELKGQISDGMWENTKPDDHWKVWSDAKVIVDPKNVGRNFLPQKDNYQLNSKVLLSAVGSRMIDDVKNETGKDYDEKKMAEDLKDLRSIFKTSRKHHDG